VSEPADGGVSDAIGTGDIGLAFTSIEPSNGFAALMWGEAARPH